MSQILEKFKFFLSKRPAVVITGKGGEIVKRMIFEVLKSTKAFIIWSEDKKIKNFEFFLKNAPLGVLVVTHVGNIPFDKDFFAGNKKDIEKTTELAKQLPYKNYLILNYDDETVREIDDITNLHTFTFGFSEKASFFVSDIKLNHGTNFKINYKGSVVPIWLENTFGKEQIYGALASAAVGVIFGINLVEISQRLKRYQTIPGKMRLLEGIKEVFIIDDTESADVFSMIEAIEILGKNPKFKRKIAVLGDVIGVGKYTIESHERISEIVVKNADLLFTFGQRAKFIAKGAFEKGMEANRIFSFEKIEDGIDKLKNTIKSGDLILVDGSKEMKMSQIVDQIRKIW